MNYRTIINIIPSQSLAEGEGVTVNRTIGTNALNVFDPFLLLDEFIIADANSGAGFPLHPHRGFETVTYMFKGQMHHEDSVGNSGTIGPNAIQWMTAGRGIIHSEMPSPDPEGDDTGVRGMQLWVNLSAKEKMKPPHYQDISAEDVPEIEHDGVIIRIIAGEYEGVKGAVDGISLEPLYLDVEVEEANSVTITFQQHHNGFIYMVDGAVEIDGQRVEKSELAVLSQGQELELEASDNTRFIVVAGRPLGEPVARYGPFVMNTREEIVEAVNDFQAGLLA